MLRKNMKRVQQVGSSEESSDKDSSDSDATPSQARPVQARAQTGQMDTAVTALVNFFLMWDTKKGPVRKQDIAKLTKNMERGSFTAVLAAAQARIRKVFGLCIVPVANDRFLVVNELQQKLKGIVSEENNKENDESGSPSTSNAFLVPCYPPVQLTDAEYQEFGLLHVVLSLIFMNGGIMSEDHLRSALRPFGLCFEGDDSTFGDVGKLLFTDFVRQLYLTVAVIPATDPPKKEIMWGPRAEAEVNKEQMLDIVCKILGNSEPRDWGTQMEAAKQALSAQAVNNLSDSVASQSGFSQSTPSQHMSMRQSSQKLSQNTRQMSQSRESRTGKNHRL